MSAGTPKSRSRQSRPSAPGVEPVNITPLHRHGARGGRHGEGEERETVIGKRKGEREMVRGRRRGEREGEREGRRESEGEGERGGGRE